MSPRPRKVSDLEVFAATQRVMGRVGPGELSLTDIAAEVGVTAGALVQRFGSKRQLLLAVVERWAEGTRDALEGLRSRHRSPLAAVRDYARCTAAMGTSTGAVAHHLSYLQMDLADPDFRRPMRLSAEATRATLERWLGEAVEVGELHQGTDVAALARLIEATVAGSLLSWAVHQEGTASEWVRRDVECLLAPHGSPPVPAGARRPSTDPTAGSPDAG